MNELRLNQLRYFCEVCDAGSVTRAANNLHITQPSISAAIKGLESAYALALFYREKNRLTLTKEGEFLHERARSILEQVDDLEVIAVITAAVAAAMGTSTDGFTVRSIRRSNTNKWRKA